MTFDDLRQNILAAGVFESTLLQAAKINQPLDLLLQRLHEIYCEVYATAQNNQQELLADWIRYAIKVIPRKGVESVLLDIQNDDEQRVDFCIMREYAQDEVIKALQESIIKDNELQAAKKSYISNYGIDSFILKNFPDEE